MIVMGVVMSWHVVAQADEVQAGLGLEVSVAGKALLVHRVDGRLYAMDAICPHHAAWFSDGRVCGEHIFCPRHQGEFHMPTGRRVGGPLCADLPVYPVRVDGNRIEVLLPGSSAGSGSRHGPGA